MKLIILKMNRWFALYTACLLRTRWSHLTHIKRFHSRYNDMRRDIITHRIIRCLYLLIIILSRSPLMRFFFLPHLHIKSSFQKGLHRCRLENQELLILEMIIVHTYFWRFFLAKDRIEFSKLLGRIRRDYQKKKEKIQIVLTTLTWIGVA